MKIRMIKHVLFIFALAAALGMGLPGSASSADKIGAFIGASAGFSVIEDDFRDVDVEAGVEGIDFDENDFAYRLFAGYRPVEFIAFEGGWRDFGNPDDRLPEGLVETDVTSFDLFAVGIVPILFVDVFAKGGIGFWDVERNAFGLKTSDSGEDFIWGIGAAVRILSFGIRAEWEQLETDHPEDLGMASVGLTYTF